MKKIYDADVKDKNVLLRIDTDVKLKDGQIENDRRLRVSLPTIKYLLEHGAKVTIIGHIDRPGGKEDPAHKIRPVEDKLIELIGTHQNWQILENLRFNSGEEENSPDFAKQLATGQDLFVQDAFATCHREHASTSAITRELPSYAGLSVQNEAENLAELLHQIDKPFTVILGGAKIADKLPVLKNLMSRADNFLIGGAVADTFLAARRHYLGKSLVEEKELRDANIIYQNLADDSHRNIYLPKDILISKSDQEAVESQTIDVAKTQDPAVMQDYISVDIGEKTIEEYKKVIAQSKTIFWNGNMGISEVSAFARGTKEIAKAVAETDARVIIGGGDTVTAFEELDIKDRDIYLSTGGGATLEYLAGKQLPGLKALK